MPRETVIPQKAVQEEILSFDHQIGTCVNVTIGTGSVDENGQFIFDQPQQFKRYEIRNSPAKIGLGGVVVEMHTTDYSDLISANPTWAPGKPAGSFRKDDLWHFVDILRARNNGV